MGRYHRRNSGLLDDIFDTLTAIFKPRVKGFVGEFSSKVMLSFLSKEKYKIINNIIVQVDGKTTQIDHVVVSNYGIFIIETKNYSGLIIGKESDLYWTQVLFKHKEKFYNPIRQNYAHKKALQEILKEYSGLEFYPIVLFDSDSKLKVESTSPVIYEGNLLMAISEKNTVIISDSIRDEIYEKLCSIKNQNKNLKSTHINEVKEKKASLDNKVQTDICPNCNGKLVLRSGKHGSFKGCSNYPKCRFTTNIK